MLRLSCARLQRANLEALGRNRQAEMREAVLDIRQGSRVIDVCTEPSCARHHHIFIAAHFRKAPESTPYAGGGSFLEEERAGVFEYKHHGGLVRKRLAWTRGREFCNAALAQRETARLHRTLNTARRPAQAYRRAEIH